MIARRLLGEGRMILGKMIARRLLGEGRMIWGKMITRRLLGVESRYVRPFYTEDTD
jgi:hypothetical protein